MESRRLPERRPQLREPGPDRFRRQGGEVGRQQLTAGALESRDETLVLELQRIRRRLEVADQLVQQRTAQDLLAPRCHAAAAAYQDRFEVGRGERVRTFAEQRRRIDARLERDAEPLPQQIEHSAALRDGGGREQGQVLFGPPLALQIDRHQVGSTGHEEPDHLAAPARVAHEGRQRGEPALGHARVGAARFAGAERRVGFVHHYRNWTDGVEQRQDPLQVRFGLALPFGPEVQELHYRDADLLGEALDDEALAGADRPADQVAHRHHVEPSLRQRARRLSQQRFGALVPGDRVEAHAAGHEGQQATARLLDQPFFLAREGVLIERRAIRIGFGEQALEVETGATRREDRDAVGVHLGERLGTAAAPREVRVALLLVRDGHGDLERAGVGHQRGRERRGRLDQQTKRDAALQEQRLARPPAQRDVPPAILPRSHPRVAAGGTVFLFGFATG